MYNENTSISSFDLYELYKSYEYLKLIVEDAAIEITCHMYRYRDYNLIIKDSSDEIEHYLYNSIEDKENYKIYSNLINELTKYCLNIIQTEWQDISAYDAHIYFIETFINNYEKEKPIIINACELPFRNIISFDMQKLILQQKFKNELKFWNRYQFIVNHTEYLLYYLQSKKDKCKLYINF